VSHDNPRIKTKRKLFYNIARNPCAASTVIEHTEFLPSLFTFIFKK